MPSRQASRGLARLILVASLTYAGFHTLTFAATPTAAKSIYGQTHIPENCHHAYLSGYETFNKAMATAQAEQDGIQAELEEGLAEVEVTTPACVIYYSLGTTDARGLLQQMVILEYLLEWQNTKIAPPEVMTRLQAANKLWFAKRFAAAGLSPHVIEQFEPASPASRQILHRFNKKMFAAAKEQKKATAFSRFVYLSSGFDRGAEMPLTARDYVRSAEGHIQVDAQNQIMFSPGSYPRAAQKHADSTYALLREYLGWNPPRWQFWSPESPLYDGYRRAFFHVPEPTLREIKEEHYTLSMQRAVAYARALDMNTEIFNEWFLLFRKKQAAVIEADLAAFEGAVKGLALAPLVVPAFAMASSGFVYAGLSTAWAANTSLLLSGGVIATYAGLGLRNALVDWQERSKLGLPFHFGDAFEHVVGTTISSFPLAATLPLTVSGLAATGRLAVVSAHAVGTQGWSALKSIHTSGYRWGGLAATGKQGVQHAYTSVKAMWSKMPEYAGWEVTADVTLTAAFEVGVRSSDLLTPNKEEQLFLTDPKTGNSYMHPQAMYTIATSVIANVLSIPFRRGTGANTLAPVDRYMGARGLSFATGMVSQPLVAWWLLPEDQRKPYDSKRFEFDQYWSATAGHLLGDFEGYMIREDNKIFAIKNLTGVKKFAAVTLLKIAVKVPLSPSKRWLNDKIVLDQQETITQNLVHVIQKSVEIDYGSRYSSADIRAALAYIFELEPELKEPILHMQDYMQDAALLELFHQ